MREERAQATAWLAPFPPGPVEKEVAVRVSPACGMRGVMVTRSVFREPRIRMWGLEENMVCIEEGGSGCGRIENCGRGGGREE